MMKVWLSTAFLILGNLGCSDMDTHERASVNERSSLSLHQNNTTTKEEPEAVDKKGDPEVLAGRCGAPDRRDHIYRTNRAFAVKFQECGRAAWGEAVETAKCLVDAYPTLTKPCAGCFGDFVGCAKDNCFWSCMLDSKGEACRKCAIDNCEAGLSRCSGVPVNQLPSES